MSRPRKAKDELATTIEREGGVVSYIKQERLEELVKSFRTRGPRRGEGTEEAGREGEQVGLDWCLGIVGCGVAK
jgi:hypothetical protein